MNTATAANKNVRPKIAPSHMDNEAVWDAYLEMLGRLQHLYNITGHPDFKATIEKAEAAIGRR
jgi:hypothetical protein